MSEPSPKEIYEDYWVGADGSGDTPTGAFSKELASLIERSLPPSARVLDAGCGDGAKYGSWLASVAGSCLGVDISGRAVEAARLRGLDAQIVPDMTATGLDPDSFDACVAIEVLEHLLHPLLAVREIGRILRPGGVLIATVPNIAYWRYRLDMAFLGRFHGVSATHPWRDPHIRFFTASTLRAMFEEAGMEILTVVGVNGSLFGDMPYVRRRFGTDTLSQPFAPLGRRAPALFGLSTAIVVRNPSSAA